ncbi:MAG: YccF domain-containing protein [Bacteroidales bacterium]
MSCLGNIVWFIFGGVLVALEYFTAGLALCLTIIGIPFGLQCFKIGIFALMPFGQEVVNEPVEVGCLSTVMNIIWMVIGGFWIALTHLLFGILLSITIVGLPFGLQHFKLMGIAFTPFGRVVRSVN